MGLKLGKAYLHESVVPFCKLSKGAVMKLLTAYQNISDGFGVSLSEIEEILLELQDELFLSGEVIRALAKGLFAHLDTDQNGLIDGLEFLSILSICSGMKKTEMVEFSLSLYDFNNTGDLSFDELVLAMKTICNGLTKIHTNPSKELDELLMNPSDDRLELFGSKAFKNNPFNNPTSKYNGSTQSRSRNLVMMFERKNIRELTEELLYIPEICSWIGMFTGYEENRLIQQYRDDEKQEIQLLPTNITRSTDELKVLSWNPHYTNTLVDFGGSYQWKSQYPLLCPVEYSTGHISSSFPDTKITLDWIYGYQTEKLRRNVLYTKQSEIVYTVSKYIIIYSPKTQTQRVFNQHIEEVLAISLHPDLVIAASCEDGNIPRVIVWDTDTLQILYQSNSHHTNGITQCVFSPNGSLLLTIDNSIEKNFVVTNWSDGTILFKDQLYANTILSATILNKNVFVIACDSSLWFWQSYSEGYIKFNGHYLKNKVKESILTLIRSSNGENVICGTILGKLMLWTGLNCIRQVKAHSGAIQALTLCTDGFLSAGKDARIRMWTNSLEPKFLFDVSKFGMSPSVMSLSISSDSTSILFGSKGSDIFEISAIDGSDLRGGPIVKSHAYGNISGLDTHPSKFEYVTIGSDRTVRIIDMKTKTLLKMAQLDVECKCIAYSPLGDIIAIGTDNSGSNGCMFVILNEENLEILHSTRDTKHPVTNIKFSPEGETLAVGARDGSIYLYSIHDDYELFAKCTKHVRPIIGIDFSVEGEWLRSNSNDGELHFFGVDDGNYQSNVSSMRDVQWATQDCIYSWHTKGIHAMENIEERQLCCVIPNNKELKYLAVASNLGQIRMYNFPSITEGGESYRYHAHCGPISQIKFSFDGSILLTAGFYDRSILQWNIVSNNLASESEAPTFENPESLKDISLELIQGEELPKQFKFRRPIESMGVLHELNPSFSQERFSWKSGIIEPSSTPFNNTTTPNISIQLKYIYGYETKVCRNNLSYTAQGDIAYTVGNYGILYKPKTSNQEVYKYHLNAITAFTASFDGQYIATGELGQPAKVSVWDAKTLLTVFILPETQAYSICSLAFSSNNQYLAIIGNDKYHTILLYDWKKQLCIGKVFGGNQKILSCCFVSFPPNEGELIPNVVEGQDPAVEGENQGLKSKPESADDHVLLTVGHEHVQFWGQFYKRFPICYKPNFKEIGSLKQTFLSCIAFQHYGIVGTQDGMLYIFERNQLKQIMKAHNGAIYSLAKGEQPTTLFTGGQDGIVRLWTDQFECKKEISLESISKANFHSVRAISVKPSVTSGQHTIIVGTQAGEVLEINGRDGSLLEKGFYMKGHSLQCWGLAVHPKDGRFATCSDDSLLRIYDFTSCKEIRTHKLEVGSRSLAFSPDGNILAIGSGCGKKVKGKVHAKEGAVVILLYDGLRVIHETRDCQLPITALMFSPDGKILAAGSEDNNVYLYNALDQFSLRYVIRTHEAPIKFLDFSQSSNFIVTVDQTNRTNYTLVTNGLSISSPGEVKDEIWSVYSSPYTYQTQGIWLNQYLSKGIEPTQTRKSTNHQFLVTVNTEGDIFLSYFPTIQRAGFLYVGQHLNLISRIAWLPEDKGFLTMGAFDCMVIHWQCIPVAAITNEASNQQVITMHYQTPEIGISLNKAYESYPSLQYLIHSDFKEKHSFRLPFPNPEDMNQGINYRDEQILFPWQSMICQPSSATKIINDPTNSHVLTHAAKARIQVNHIHGWQRGPVQPAVYYNIDGNIIYFVSNRGILYDRSSTSQRYYIGHRHEISSSAIDISRQYIATGEHTAYPELHIWSSFTTQSISVFKGYFTHSIRAIAFSTSGHSLVAIGNDKFQTAAIFHSPSGTWTDGYFVTSFSTHITVMSWVVYDESRDYPIVIGGLSNRISTFRIVNSSILKQIVSFDESQVIETGTSATIVDSLQVSMPVLLCGSHDGFIFVVNRFNEIIQKVSGHEGAIYSIIPLNQYNPRASSNSGSNEIPDRNELIVTLGYDHCIRVWNPSLKLLTHIDLTKHYMPSISDSKAFVGAFSPERQSLLLGFYPCLDLIECSLYNPSQIILTEGHSSGEIHGLSCHPTLPLYATSGDDSFIRIWHYNRKKSYNKKFIKFPSRALRYSADGEILFVGIGRPDREFQTPKDGTIMIFKSATLQLMREEKKCKGYITDIQLNQDGSQLLVTGYDGSVLLLDSTTLNTLGKVEIPEIIRPALRADLSVDNQYARILYEGNKLLFFNFTSKTFEPSPMVVKDVIYASNSVPFAWTTQAIFGIYDEALSETLYYPPEKLAVVNHQPAALTIASVINPSETIANDSKEEGLLPRTALKITALVINEPIKAAFAAFDNGELRIFPFPCLDSRIENSYLITKVSSYFSRLILTPDNRNLIGIEVGSRGVYQIDLQNIPIVQ